VTSGCESEVGELKVYYGRLGSLAAVGLNKRRFCNLLWHYVV